MFHQNPFAVASRSTARLRVSLSLLAIFFALLIATSGTFLAVDAGPQGQTQSRGVSNPAPKKNYTLRIVKEAVTGISLKAEKARLSEIGADLSRQLGARVILGPSMEKEVITVEFADLTLELGLPYLAPRVYIDYEIRADAQPKPLGIFLLGYDDPEPAASAVVQGTSEAMLIEGNTEDSPEQSEIKRDERPLQVDLKDNRLTIKSKKQRLAAVLLTIAQVLGVPAEIKYESNEIVDTEIKDTLFEDAITRLSPNIRLYVRSDLTRSQRTPLRLALVLPPAKVTGQ